MSNAPKITEKQKKEYRNTLTFEPDFNNDPNECAICTKKFIDHNTDYNGNHVYCYRESVVHGMQYGN
jgi:hypothetical protein